MRLICNAKWYWVFWKVHLPVTFLNNNSWSKYFNWWTWRFDYLCICKTKESISDKSYTLAIFCLFLLMVYFILSQHNFLKRCLGLKLLNPLTCMSDQGRISPYNIKTILSRQVMRIKKNISLGVFGVDPIQNSPK